MEMLKKFFPFSFVEKKDVASLVINVLIHIVVGFVIGLVIGLFIGGAVGMFTTALMVAASGDDGEA